MTTTMYSLARGARVCSSLRPLLCGISRKNRSLVYEHRTCVHQRRMCTTTCKKGDGRYPLTHRETVSYIEDVLLMPDCQKLAEADPPAFLDRLTLQTKYRIPYSVLPFVSGAGFHVPSLEESKESMFTRHGGNCTVINLFTEAVLEQLGLETYCVPSSAYRRLVGSHMISHIGIIVKNLSSPGSLHLYDPGSHTAMSETVPLDFESSSPTYTRYQQDFKYFRASHGAINFCQRVDLASLEERKLPALLHFEAGDFWEEQYVYNIHEPRDLAYFEDMTRHESFRNLCVTEIMASGDIFISGFPDGLRVDLSLKRCLTIDQNGVKKVTKINNGIDLLENVRRYFPHMSTDKVARVAEHFMPDRPLKFPR